MVFKMSGRNWSKEVDRICKFIQDTVKESGTKGVVLGLSGGIDSAVVMALGIKALHNKVECFYFTDNIIDDSIIYENVKELLKSFNMSYNFERYNISSAMAGFEAYYGIKDKAKGNFKSRLIMNHLRVEAELHNYLLIGTTNKSEYLIGYYTKYGDGGVDFEPIQHLYKTEIYELAKYLNVPESILKAKPSAGLWEGQTDKEEIGMSYDRLDKILMFHKDEYPYDIAFEGMLEKGFTGDEIHKIYEMIRNSRHKRHMPKGIEIDVGHTYWYR